ncbi:MAG: hypothetical protein ACFFAE_18625 [Candidatus Hodarchaeota archaeon]
MPMKIGNDEFCSNCMEWREFDEDGKCKVCGKYIVKQVIKDKTDSYAEYERETADIEESEEE